MSTFFENTQLQESSPSVVINVIDCDIIVSEFESKARIYVQFWTNIFEKRMNPLISPAVG